ncbi:MAG: zinc ribbon domain-containing protein, partial [Thermoplasmataceae archaeon]
MPIYESDEHEILSERTLLFDHGVKVSKGSLYLTNKRIIYVRNGRRGIFRAAPSLVDMEVKLDALEDVGKAVPRLNMGKKRIVSIRFYQGASLQIKDFSVSNPELWEKDIRQWATEYKRRISEENRRNIEDEKKRELEMAKAKAPTANIGYMYYGKSEGGNKKR